MLLQYSKWSTITGIYICLGCGINDAQTRSSWSMSIINYRLETFKMKMFRQSTLSFQYYKSMSVVKKYIIYLQNRQLYFYKSTLMCVNIVYITEWICWVGKQIIFVSDLNCGFVRKIHDVDCFCSLWELMYELPFYWEIVGYLVLVKIIWITW